MYCVCGVESWALVLCVVCEHSVVDVCLVCCVWGCRLYVVGLGCACRGVWHGIGYVCGYGACGAPWDVCLPSSPHLRTVWAGPDVPLKLALSLWEAQKGAGRTEGSARRGSGAQGTATLRFLGPWWEYGGCPLGGPSRL